MQFGKTRVRTEAEGCIGCGTLWCSGWREYARLPVKVGNQSDTITLHICADCDRKGVKPNMPEGALTEGQTEIKSDTVVTKWQRPF